MRVTGYCFTHIGSRHENQDSLLVDNERGLFAVADGIGGGERGDVASQMAVTGIRMHPQEAGSLRETVETIQKAVLKEALDSLGDARMGTTLTALKIRKGVAELCHVGDSRCYRYFEGHLELLTTDHEAFDETYGAPVLASYLGIPTDLFPFLVQEDTLVLKPGERLLLCSDGLYKQITENELIAHIEANFREPEKLLKTMVEQATSAPHSDNVTVVYIEVEES